MKDEMTEAPSFRKRNPADFAIYYMRLSSASLPISTLNDYAETVLQQRMSAIEGVAQIQFWGQQKFAVRVQIDPDRLVTKNISLDDVERAVLDRLSVRYEEWLVHGSRPGLDAWTGRALFLSEPVRVDNTGSQVEGVFEGVTGEGALILQTKTGRTIIVAGDLVRGPRPNR